MERSLRAEVSRYMSYLLRHNSENLKMDEYGFVDVNELLEKLHGRFHIDRRFMVEVVEKSQRKRFEIMDNKIRALYGHTISVKSQLEEDTVVEVLYHGTTPDAASEILKEGLKPMERRWVHLSPTMVTAVEVGLRRTKRPIVLEIDAKSARENSLRFYKATDKVYVSGPIPARYIRIVS
jgi:putative RNA 2'-phosphotransferase